MNVFHTITILLCLLYSSHAKQEETRVPGELVRFDFTENQCKKGSFSNRVGASIVRTSLVRNDHNHTLCSRGGVGIESSRNSIPKSPILRTNKDNTALLQQLKHSGRGVSFELWFKPHKTNSDVSGNPIFTLGNKLRSVTSEQSTCGEHEEADFQIAQSGSLLKIHYSSSETGFNCRNPSLVAFPLEENQLVHLVITLTNKNQNAYMNGQSNPYNHEWDASLDPKFNHWHSDYMIQVFGDSYTTQQDRYTRSGVWPGTIYRFAIYDRVLSKADVRKNFAVGLPPSYPVAFDFDVHLNEDAELVAGSHEPIWYDSYRNVTTEAHDLQMIDLKAVSLDWDVHRLQKSQNISGINEPQEVSIYILEPIPFHTAVIYHADGIPVVDNYEKLMNSSIYVIPEKDAYGSFSEPYAYFRYCVTYMSDKLEDGFVDHCNVGMVSVYVSPVNDPPIVVTDPSNTTIPTGVNHSTLISLEGKDIDGHLIGGIIFTAFPRYGNLHIPVHACGRSSSNAERSYLGIIYDEIIDSAQPNITMDGEGPFFHVGYRYTGPEDLVGLDGTTISDSFKYKFYDWEGALSAESTFKILVVSSLIVNPAGPENPFVVLEDTPTDVLLHGADFSGRNRNISFQITGLPPHIHGIFYDENNPMARIEVGSILKQKVYPPYDKNLPIHFKPAQDFFNYPHWNSIRISVTISYRVIVFDDVGRIIASSGNARQEIRVVNVNDRPQIIVPTKKKYRVAYARTFVWNNTACSYGAIKNGTFSNRHCRMRVPIRGIKVIDPDEYVDRVRVVINTTHGRMMLDPNYIDLTDSQSCAERDYSYWRCRGNVLHDNNMTFMALPADLNKILSTIYFWSGKTGNDTLVITIYDGMGGSECGYPEELAESRLLHSTSVYDRIPDNSSHPHGCYMARASIPIQVLPIDLKKEFEIGPEPVPPQVYFVLSLAPLFLWVLWTWKQTIDEYDSDDDDDEEIPEEDREHTMTSDEFVDTVGSIMYGLTNNGGDNPLPEHQFDTASSPSASEQANTDGKSSNGGLPTAPKTPSPSSLLSTSRQIADYDAAASSAANSPSTTNVTTKAKPRWEKHVEQGSGIPYFLDTQTGTVTWRPPPEAEEGQVLNR